MNLDDTWGMIAFLGIFEVLGGGAVGFFFRSLIQRKFEAPNFFFLIWGTGFGGIPFLIGAAMFLSSGHPSFFFLQGVIFVMPILVIALTPSGLFEGLDSSADYQHALIGGVMTLVGAGLVLFTARQGINVPLLLGFAIGGIGALILLFAVVRVLHATTT